MNWATSKAFVRAAVQLPIPFPTEVEALRKQCQAEQQLSPAQRLRAALDAARAADTLSQAGRVRQAQLRYQQQLEEDWARRMKEFIQRHVAS
jgi:Skp family chaperone for outer membrane proteins